MELETFKDTVLIHRTAVIGVFNGCFYTDPTTKKPTLRTYYPGSIAASDITAFVVDDPDAVFLIDADAAFH